MIVGACEIDLWIPESRSLKQKRFAIKSLKERIKNRFNVSAAEVDHHDLWQRCRLGVVVASTDTRYAHQVLSKVVDYVRSDGRVELLDYTIEMR
ncbi:MAG: DUF503 domain-containing protein [Candidatus Latescibacteria bacterium]|nr:DUF503 domain-containing protein [Candidatus Latescibacterota bacterium]MCK5329063.1 DUF503 domain-containing protein [Candidatus Latescibacterota bacterium]MCK5527665.1 DUF503 domain-containing protein [Candidatus Latescibacterota bacterium]MCK5733461.1 DUF503 domain-containing protein [Candidatus Latescibacterota bacterium]